MQIIGVLLSILFGFIPMFFFAYAIYWIDRYEKEPVRLLGGVFFWGAVVAAGAAFLINTIVGLGVYMFTGSQAFTELSTGSVVAPVIEETLKGLACLLVFIFFRREFDSILDGIVYAAITAIGFAATENVYYLYTYGFQQTGFSGVLEMFFIRVIWVGWQHPFYTSFIGIGLAIARLSRNSSIKFISPLIGWTAAVVTHSFHNTLSTIFQGDQVMLFSILVDWSGWIVMALFILWALFREQKWIIAQLGEEVASGVITPAQYHTACSARARDLRPPQVALLKTYRLTNRFYALTAELAYKKHQAASLGEQARSQPEIDSLRSELTALSTRVST